jgi:ATP-dependent RNA circularization protein (DNA/RNA ligase family)
MIEYPKINTIFKRDENGKIIYGSYSLPVFELLKDITWVYTEKVDGTNVRVTFKKGHNDWIIAGRTDRATIPTFLMDKLRLIFNEEKWYMVNQLFQNATNDFFITFYGEGFGNRIQSTGKLYNPTDTDFVCFDILINNRWQERETIQDICEKLSLNVVPVIGHGNLSKAVYIVRNGFKSTWGNFLAEGLVLRPKIELCDKFGQRVITKIKYKDFK